MARILAPRWSFILMLALAPVTTAAERAINAHRYESALLEASGHPDELSRWRGIWNYDNGRAEEALRHFERAALHGDKLSQHFLTLMYWNGDGVDRDPVQAYIWADLAAERGNSDDLVRVREHIWSELDAAQREKAVATGGQWYDRYGDAVAMKRNNTELRRFMRTQTGSHVGLLTSRLDVAAGHPDLWASGATSSFGPHTGMGTDFHADSRSRPEAYYKAQDLSLDALMKRIGAGTVDIGEVRKVRTPAEEKPTDDK